MVTIEIKDDMMILDVQGWDKLWALKSQMEIPLKNISGVYADPSTSLGWWKGIRAPGTHIPGVIVAGTFYQHGKRIFWDVKKPENTIIIDLNDERYHQLIVEVDNPTQTVDTIMSALNIES